VNLLVRLSDLYFYRANRSAADVDSAFYYTTAAQKLATSLAYEKGLAEVYFQQGEIFPLKILRKKGQHATEAAIKLFSKQKNYRMLGEAYYRLAGYFSISDAESLERIKYTKLSLDAFRSAGLTLKEGTVLQRLGDLYQDRGEYGAALSSLKQALQVYQSIKYEQLMGVYDLLGSVYTSLGAPEEGVKYGILALRNAQALGDTSIQLSTLYNRIGVTYYMLKEADRALKNYENALRIAEKYQDIQAIHIISANLVLTYIHLRKFAEAAQLLNKTERKYPFKELRERYWIDKAYIKLFREQKQYDRATKYIDEVLKIVGQGLTPERTDMVYTLLIEFYFSKKDYASLKKYINLHKKVMGDNFNGSYRTYFWQSKLDSVNHRYLSSLAEYQKYSILKDSVFNESKSRQINQLEIIYETEKKEENIQAMRKESVLQQNMLRQASLIQNITFISIALLLIIIGLLIYGYRLVKNNNKVMAVRQEEINNKNISLGRLLTEKEWLMKEIHHRVKNNLHMIVGLLESQSEFLKGDEAKMALAESEHRIQSMSMIHQKLYQSDNLTSIEILPYIHELVEYLKDSFESKAPVTFNLDIERLEMNISHSIPLGLILNEAIINSLKYAFPDGKGGSINVVFKQIGSQNFVLIVSDNGIGLNPDFDTQKINSFGLTLIKGLTEELGGKLIIENNGGTTVQVHFRYVQEEKLAVQYASM
jgi:two-component sensor histidine kinase